MVYSFWTTCGFRVMKKRKVIYIIIFIMLGIWSYFQISKEITEYQKKIETERSIQNVFDEMVVNDCEGLRNAEYINVLEYSTRYEIVSMEFASIAENISSFMTKRLWDYEGLGTGDSLFISFYFSDPAKDYEGTIVFAYNHQMHKLYIYQQDGEIPLEDLERYRDYLLGEVLLGSWLDNGESRFSWDDLGKLEIVDYLLPYEYCGTGGNNADEEKAIYQKEYTNRFRAEESYITWLESDELLCLQQKIEYDDRGDRDAWGRIWFAPDMYKKMLEESYGQNLGSSRFIVQEKESGKICSLSDIVNINDEFITWMKESGKAEGNLPKASKSREDGMKATQQMLADCPAERMEEELMKCEFYIEPGYLHIRFPYWSQSGESPGWQTNGNSLWKNWLTIKTEDIEAFLKVEKW